MTDRALIVALNRLTLALCALGLALIVVNWTLEDVEYKLSLISVSLRRLAPPPSRDGGDVAPEQPASPTAAEGVEGSEAHA